MKFRALKFFALVVCFGVVIPAWAKPSSAFKSSKARKIKDAYEALDNDEFSKARAFVSPLLRDPVYADWALGISASALRGEALALFKDRQFKSVRTSCENSITYETQIEMKYPFSPFAKSVHRDIAQAQILEADAAWGMKRWKETLSIDSFAFDLLLVHGTLVSVSSESLAHFAEACSKQKSEDCQQWLVKFLSGAQPKSAEAQSIFKFVPSLVDLGHPPKFSHSTQPYKAPDLDAAAYDSAMQIYWKGNTKQAAESFQKFIGDFPKSSYRFRARYFLGDSLMQSPKGDEGKKLLSDLLKDTPLSYYGLLAALALNQTPDTSLVDQNPKSTDTDAFILPSEDFKLKRVRAFIAEGANELAALELKDLKPRDGLSNAFLFYLANLGAQAKNYGFAFQVLSELGQRGAPDLASNLTLEIIFPVVHYDIIQKYATQYHLDPILVLSLIKQESAFDEKIFSAVGAQGLMQLMPATATEILGELEKDDLLDADKNIQAGTKYLAKLLDRFKGNSILALAGYNAGPAAVDRWLKESQFKSNGTQFIETIPYKETREYVGSIIRNYFWYSKKLKAEQKPLTYFWVNP